MKLLLAFLAVISISAYAEPKAYDLVKYKGKAGGVTIVFEFANGYPTASEVKVTEGKITTKFVLDGGGEMHFVPEKSKNANKTVVIKMGMEDEPGETIDGSYTANGKTVSFTLRQQ